MKNIIQCSIYLRWLFLFFASCLIFSGCGKKKSDSSRQSAEVEENIESTEEVESIEQVDSKVPDAPTATPEEPVRVVKEPAAETKLLLAKVDVGVKNYLQINASFAALTSIPINTASVVSAFDEVKNQLPATNNIKFFTAGSQVGIAKLAVAYCDEMMNSDGIRTAKVPDFNFQASVADALNEEGSKLLVDGLISSFWNGLVTEAEKTDGAAALTGLIEVLKAGSESGDGTVTLNISKAICTATLSNSAIVLL